MMIPAGGAVSVSRESRLMKLAMSAAGRRLVIQRLCALGSHGDLRRGEESVEKTEKSSSVLDVQDIDVEKPVESSVKVRVVPLWSAEAGAEKTRG
jgi:hypothetical protein